MTSFVLEGPGGIPGLKQVPSNGSVVTNTNWIFSGNVTVQGTLSAASESITSEIITAASANALAVGRVGITNPTFNVDTSTALVATGLNIKGAAAAGGVALSVLSSGTNESATFDAKGTGTIGINTLGTTSGLVTIGNSTSLAGVAVNGPLTSGAHIITSASASAMVVGLGGATNPALQVDASTVLSATGIKVTSAAAAGGLAIAVISSGAAESLTIDAKGAGSITLGTFSSGNIVLNRNSVMGTNRNLSAGFAGTTAFDFSLGTGIFKTTTGAVSLLGATTVRPDVATPAAGSTTAVLLFGSTAAFGIYYGSGAPTVTAAQGSLYLRSDGSSISTRLYVNTTGSTTWTNFTSVA